MRKIVSREEAEKKERRSRRFIGFSLLAIMVLSVFGIVVDSIGKNQNDPSKISYRGVNFNYQQERWMFTKYNQTFFVVNPPENVSGFSIGELHPIEAYSGKPLYIYSDNQAVEYNVGLNMGNVAFRIQPACLDAKKCEGDYPIKTCADNFIVIEESNESGITQEQNCVRIRGPDGELQRLADAFMLKVLGIN